MAVITIVGSGMMGSALAFPARENGHEVRLDGTHLDRDIIAACREKGVLVLSAKTKLRLLPPLNIPMELLTEAMDVIVAALK